MPVPVGVLRLPRGPEGSSRGFSCDSPRWRAPPGGEAAEVQRLRAALRQRFLRGLAAARQRPARFWLLGGLRLEATFGAADVEPVAIQVDELRTPLGVQDAALLRCGDLVAFSFPLR